MLIVDEREAMVRHAQRATGQASALASMIATKQPFAAVAQQLLAARGSLDSLLLRLVELELRDCVSNQAARDEIDALLRIALGRDGRNRPLRSRHRPSPTTSRAARIIERASAP